VKAVPQIGFIAVASLAASAVTWLAKGPPNRAFVCHQATLKPGEVCLEQVAGHSGILWVDARSRTDWETSGVPGSILWNLDGAEDMQAFEAETAMKIAEGAARVIVYCGDENCGVSTQVAERIRKLDLGPDVQVLRGGWRALSEAGRVRGSSPRS
jgi:rhodanese-related sulfurtransferase